jgi:hypothetical protein
LIKLPAIHPQTMNRSQDIVLNRTNGEKELDYVQHFSSDLHRNEEPPQWSSRIYRGSSPTYGTPKVKDHEAMHSPKKLPPRFVTSATFIGFSGHSDLSQSTISEFSGIPEFYLPPSAYDTEQCSTKKGRNWFPRGADPFGAFEREEHILASIRAEIEELQRNRDDPRKKNGSISPEDFIQNKRRRMCLWGCAVVITFATVVAIVVSFATMSGLGKMSSTLPPLVRSPVSPPTTDDDSDERTDTLIDFSPGEDNTWNQQPTVLRGAGEGDNFGSAVAFSTDSRFMAVGANQNALGGNDGDSRGYVKVFRATQDGGWLRMGQTLTGESNWDNCGFSLALNDSAQTLAVGCPGSPSSSGFSTGQVRVYIFKPETETWAPLGKSLSGDYEDDNFGYYLALSSDGFTLAIGTKVDGGEGYVKVFAYSRSRKFWFRQGHDLDGVTSGCIMGDIILSGDGSRLACRSTEKVKAFEFLNYNWEQLGNDIDLPSGAVTSGKRIAMSKDGSSIAAVDGEGRLLVVRLNESKWQLQDRLLGDRNQSRDAVATVSLNYDGSVVAIGIPKHDATVTSTSQIVKSGLVIVYKNDGRYWQQQGNILLGSVDNDCFGQAIALDDEGNVVAVGAQGVGGAGYVVVFEFVE